MQQELIPDCEQIYGWIEEIFSWGIRRPGYPADVQAESYSLAVFQQAGLDNVHMEPVQLPYWKPQDCSLTVITNEDQFQIECFPLPHSAPVDKLEIELALYEEGNAMAVNGRAALHSLPLMQVPPTLLVDGGEQLDDLNRDIELEVHSGGIILDSSETLRQQTQILPFSGLIQEVMEPAMAAGAEAFIGILAGYPGDSCDYYVPYDGVERPIPGVWIRGSDGIRLVAALNQGVVRIQLTLQSERKMITGHNIVGELPGVDDETVIIGSHHDGPWSSAVEDASGMALVYAQAHYWSKVPQSGRPHRLQFLLNAGHMAGGAGCLEFIRAHKEELEQIVLEIHLEHAAAEFREHEGKLEPTGFPEPRWFFTSRNPELQQAVVDALRAEGVDRALIIPPDTFGDRPTTDGGAFHLAGVPLVNYLTAPFYLFDSMDTLDKIHKPSLEPITRVTIRLVEAMANISARRMRGVV